MLCSKCKKEIDETSIYCKYCGIKLGKKNISATPIIISTIFVVCFFSMLFAKPQDVAFEKIPYINFVKKLDNNEIDKIDIVVSKITAVPKEKSEYKPNVYYFIDSADIPFDEFTKKLSNNSIETNFINRAEDLKNSPLTKFILFFVIFLYTIGVFRFFKNKKS